jgi:hypothetical protein
MLLSARLVCAPASLPAGSCPAGVALIGVSLAGVATLAAGPAPAILPIERTWFVIASMPGAAGWNGLLRSW